MKQRKIILILTILLSIAYCKKEQKPVTEAEKPLFESVLSENDKVVKSLLTTEEVSPNISALLASVEALQAAKGGLEPAAQEMRTALETAKSPDAKVSFVGLSKFSELLADTMKANGLQSGRNRFYCPMVKKTWVFSGQRIENPYAADMRDCGDLIP
ncbi:hypothetical protein EHQ53_05690 [Leptospira langatensis]|uniref:DUF3347 domain-containing protein n=1 Tax=Leptospira langatensis TaxID=2484983 RepID=A0A5F1ZTV4_9LEPT|nr:hypothetical protein [Leptospira langatensis]TGK02957.1 hypothetical protein EHO57_06525 [Leptospira langatensis]TGL41712.1 hypothetical protein EHQ53_05690 [Leptospira langatensis]